MNSASLCSLWRAGTITLFLLDSYSPHRLFKNSSSEEIRIWPLKISGSVAKFFLNKCLSFHFPLKRLLKMSENIVSFANGDFRNQIMIKGQVLSEKSMLTFLLLINPKPPDSTDCRLSYESSLSYLSCTLRTVCLHERSERKNYVRGLFVAYNICIIKQ